MDKVNESDIKLCCATFYQSDLIRGLLGDVLHPGGLEMTAHLGRVIGLEETDRLLDIACGRGASAVYLAKRFSCHATGLDYGPKNIAAAEAHASAQGVSRLTTFQEGDAERLLFDDGTFDVIISECSFCTFPDKTKAAAEMVRVLRASGRLGMTDITVNGSLPEDVQSLLGWVACVAGAGTSEDYVSILEEAGFTSFTIQDKHSLLVKMINNVRLKLLGAELAAGLGKLSLGTLDLSEAKRLARRAVELIDNGLIGYTLITAKKE